MNVSYDPQNEVIVTVGGSEAIDISLRALINPGDEVLIVEPCFVCFTITIIYGRIVRKNTQSKRHIS